MYEGIRQSPGGQDFEAFLIISENPQGGVPSQAYCRTIRDNNGLTYTVLRDMSGAVNALGLPPNHMHFVWREGMQIEHRSQYNDRTWPTVVRRILDE